MAEVQRQVVPHRRAQANPDVQSQRAGDPGQGRAAFTTHEWRDLLIRSIGLEPNALDERAKMVVLMRNAPFVETSTLWSSGPAARARATMRARRWASKTSTPAPRA
jgi:predicted ATP-dependent Lon-type protease